MAKLTDLPEIVRVAKLYRNVQEAIEVGTDFDLVQKGNKITDVPNGQALTFLNNRLSVLRDALNNLGVDANV